MINVGIAGAAGYVGGELIRLLVNHPEVNKIYPMSESQRGKPINTVHQDLFNTNLKFEAEIPQETEVIFICKGHGKSRQYLEEYPPSKDQVVIDLSTDFRIEDSSNPFVYGLPEKNRSRIKRTNRIANCGCFATAIQLAILPLLKSNLITEDVHINGVTGSTGAGQAKLNTTHFSWRESNISLYKAFEHQHMNEVNQLIHQLNPEPKFEAHFIPMRGNFTRGILISLYTKVTANIEEIMGVYKSCYDHEPFMHVTTNSIHLKQVVNTNQCLIQVEKKGDRVLVTSIIDNLLKGAAGQAIQNMNIRFGFDEKSSLHLKAAAF